MAMLTVAEKRARFAELHAGPGCFIIPNPWDIGSTKYLASLGFKALATTSAGAAFAAGKPDGGMTRAEVLRHVSDLVAATDLPFNADYEAGFAATRDELYESVTRCIATGLAGFSIEDFTGDSSAPFFAPREAADRIRSARAAINASGQKVLLTARSETVLRGHPDALAEAVRRLESYAEAGADVLYAPGLRTSQEVTEVVRCAGPLPVNVLAGGPGFTLRQLEDLGVRRISVGASLARTAWGAFMCAAQDIALNGRFDSFADGAPSGDLNKLFREGRS
jgi:2-methylisocitrate lyase-like PEP mutase family enzyme